MVTDPRLDGAKLDISLGNFGYKKGGFSYAKQLDGANSIELWGHMVDIEGEVRSVSAQDDGAKTRIDGKEIIDRYPFPTGGIGARLRFNKWELNFLGHVRQYKQPRGASGALSWQDINRNDYYTDIFNNGKIGEEHQYLVLDLQRTLNTQSTEHRLSLNFTYSKLRLFENTKSARDIEFPADWDSQAISEYSMGELFEFTASAYQLGLGYSGHWTIEKGKSILWGAEVFRTQPLDDTFRSNYQSNVVEGEIIKTPIPGGYFRTKPDGVFDKLRVEWLSAIFAEIRWQLVDLLYISAGARFDVHLKGKDFRQKGQADRYPDPASDEKRANIDRTSHQVSPRIALVYRPFKDNLLTTKAIYNRSFIAPGYFYRYADPSTSYAGGPWLKPETLESMILELEGIFEHIGWKALYFVYINKNLLYRDSTFKPARYTSSGQLAMHGLEAELHLNWDFLTVFSNYTLMKGLRSQTDQKEEDKWIMGNDSIKNFPSHFGSFGATGRLLGGQLALSMVMLWNAKIRSPVSSGVFAETVQSIDPSVQFDVNISYLPQDLPVLKDTEIRLSVFNVLDSRIQRGGTIRLPYAVAGRWALVTLSKKL